MKKIYPPLICPVCGREFVPVNYKQFICSDPECKRTRHREKMRIANEKHREKYRERNRRHMWASRHPEREPKPDTIVAEGYAERQVAKTLAGISKIKVEL